MSKLFSFMFVVILFCSVRGGLSNERTVTNARTWTNRSGRTSIPVSFARLDETTGIAYFASPDGRKLFKCSLNDLCDTDAQLVQSIVAAMRPTKPTDKPTVRRAVFPVSRVEPETVSPSASDPPNPSLDRKGSLKARIDELQLQRKGLTKNEVNQGSLELNRLDLVISAAEFTLLQLLVAEAHAAGKVLDRKALDTIKEAQDRIAKFDVELFSDVEMRTYRDVLALDREITREWMIMLQEQLRSKPNIQSVNYVGHSNCGPIHGILHRLRGYR